jgi:hypothetical protein
MMNCVSKQISPPTPMPERLFIIERLGTVIELSKHQTRVNQALADARNGF